MSWYNHDVDGIGVEFSGDTGAIRIEKLPDGRLFIESFLEFTTSNINDVEEIISSLQNWLKQR